jgi:hypothetical protein
MSYDHTQALTLGMNPFTFDQMPHEGHPSLFLMVSFSLFSYIYSLHTKYTKITNKLREKRKGRRKSWWTTGKLDGYSRPTAYMW